MVCMQARTFRLALLLYLAPLVYLFEANILAMTGTINLPFSLVTSENSQSFAIQITLLVMQLVGLLTLAFVTKRRRLQTR